MNYSFTLYTGILDEKLIAVKPEFKLDLLLEYCHETAFKSFDLNSNTAKTLELEFILRLAGTKQISKALRDTKPELNSPCLLLSFNSKTTSTLTKKEQEQLEKNLWNSQKKFFNWTGNQKDLELDLIEQRAITFA